MAGYSGTPLVQKLGIKPGFAVAFVKAPAGFVKQLDLPHGVKIRSPRSTRELDFVLFFVKQRTELLAGFSQYASKLKANGVLWISWPKKTSGVKSDLTDNVVREIGLAAGLVDVKVCAVDEIWSGLKFVYRVADRAKLKARLG
jgi:hypothetical protein